jgi:hypothetical protein
MYGADGRHKKHAHNSAAEISLITFLFWLTTQPLPQIIQHWRRATAQAGRSQLPTAAAAVRSQSGHVKFVVDTEEPGQVFSEYLQFHYQFPFNQLLHSLVILP